MAEAKSTIARVQIDLTGTVPLLMHNPRTVDPLDPLTIKIRDLTGLRKKTEDQHREIQRLEWLAGLYHNPNGVYVPGEWLEACIQEIGGFSKKKSALRRGFLVEDDQIPLHYAGETSDIDALWASGKAIDYRSIKNSGSGGRVMRTRPRFSDWHLSTTASILVDQIDLRELFTFVKQAGLVIGLGDYRPRYGRFTAVVKEI